MSESGIAKVGVIGIGTMGCGIAQVAAQSGFETVVVDISDEVVQRGMAHIEKSLAGRKARLDVTPCSCQACGA